MKKGFRVPFGTIVIPESTKTMIVEILATANISMGKYVRSFEQRFARLHGRKEGVAVSSGADAVTLALAVLHDRGAKRGDEIILPALSFIASANAVVHAGFTPVFVDIDRATLNIDPAQIEAKITDRTRAVLPVHLMGKPAPMNEILDIASRYDLVVIEDAAEAHGGTYHRKPLGSIGVMGAFSLYIAHIITTGEGGIVITDDPVYADILRSLRAHGRNCSCRECTLSSHRDFCAKRFDEKGADIRFLFDRIGYSCKMNELEAAIGLGNLEIYSEILEKRYRNLRYILDRFDRFRPYLVTIGEEAYEKIGPHALPIVVQENAGFGRNELAVYLEASGVETRTLFASIPTQYKAYRNFGHRLGSFPAAEYIGENGLHIGVHHGLDEADMDYVLEVLDGFIDKKRPTG